MYLFNENQFSEMWQNMLTTLLDADQCFVSQSRTGTMHELIGASAIVLDSSSPVPPGRALNMQFANSLAEAIWRGDADGSQLAGLSERAKRFLEVPADLPNNISVMYGPRFRAQLSFVLSELASYNGSRRAIAYIGDADDQKYVQLENCSHLEFPCTSVWQFFLREGKLEMHVHMRSQSAWRILPIDYLVATYVQRQLVQELNCILHDLPEPIGAGAWSASFGSLHIFSEEFELIAGYLAGS